MGGQLVRYGSYTVEQAQKDREESEKAGGSRDFWSVPVGKTTIRFLPPRVGSSEVFRVRYQHWIDVPGAEKRINFICPRMQAKQDKIKQSHCPACAKLDELREDGSPAALDLSKGFEARRSVLANIILRGDPERGVIIWAMPKGPHDQLLALRDDETSGGDFSNPIDGFDVVVVRVGKGMMDTKYTVNPARNLTSLASDEETMNAWLESMHDLDRLVQIPSPEEIRRLTGGGGAERPRAAPSRAAAPARGAAARSAPAATKRRTAADDAIDTEGVAVDEDE